jgi:oligosaccharide repeat unit polymerase
LLGLIQALSTAGRSQVLFLLLPIFLGYYKWKNNRVPFVVMLLLIGFVFTFIIYGDIIFMSFRNETGNLGNNIDYIWSFLKEFIHPIGSLMMWMNKVENGSGFGYFRDIYLSILNFLPERALGISLPNTVSYYNTYELTGIAKAIIPPGLIGFFYYSFGVVGVVIGSIAFGLVFGVLNHIFLKLNNKNPIFTILYVAYAMSIVGLMMGGDPTVYMNLNFWNLFIGFFLCLLISKR